MRTATEYIVLTPTGWHSAAGNTSSDFRQAAPFSFRRTAWRYADTIEGAQVWTRTGDKIRQVHVRAGNLRNSKGTK